MAELLRKRELNEAHKVVPVSQDRDSSNGTTRRQVLITRILFNRQNECSLMK